MSEPSSAITVGAVDPSDDAGIAALAALRFRWRTEEGDEGGDLAAFVRAFATWVRDNAASHTGFLARRGDDPVGMAWLGIVQRTPGPEHFVRLSGMLQSAYVVPEARDLGAGTLLVDAVVSAARERELSYLIVHPTERSYPLYERAGFAETSAVLELGLTRPRPSRGAH